MTGLLWVVRLDRRPAELAGEALGKGRAEMLLWPQGTEGDWEAGTPAPAWAPGRGPLPLAPTEAPGLLVRAHWWHTPVGAAGRRFHSLCPEPTRSIALEALTWQETCCSLEPPLLASGGKQVNS